MFQARSGRHWHRGATRRPTKQGPASRHGTTRGAKRRGERERERQRERESKRDGRRVCCLKKKEKKKRHTNRTRVENISLPPPAIGGAAGRQGNREQDGSGSGACIGRSGNAMGGRDGRHEKTKMTERRERVKLQPFPALSDCLVPFTLDGRRGQRRRQGSEAVEERRLRCRRGKRHWRAETRSGRKKRKRPPQTHLVCKEWENRRGARRGAAAAEQRAAAERARGAPSRSSYLVGRSGKAGGEERGGEERQTE